MRIDTVVLQNEDNCLEAIADLIGQFDTDIEIVGSSGHVEEGVQLILERLPQLVIMDVALADGTGFDVLTKLAYRPFELIVIAEDMGYTLDAIRASAVDYLLKPVNIKMFGDAIHRARKRISEKKGSEFTDTLSGHLALEHIQKRKMGISTRGGCEFIYVENLLWCTSKGCYTHFYLADGTKLISSRNIGFYETFLCANNCYRIHNSCIVNLDFIKSYVKGKNGYIILTDGTRLEISQRRKAEFLERFT